VSSRPRVRGWRAAFVLPACLACVLPVVIGENDPPPSPPPDEQECGQSRPVDILFVIDNSGSMKEEQERLAAAVSSASEPDNPCNGFGFVDLEKYAAENCHRPPFEWEEPYASDYLRCGLVERLRLRRNKFHIGVISTDLNDCDSPYGALDPRGSVPQRGCLQTSVGDSSLSVITWETPAAGERLAAIIRNVEIFGSAYEKGLGAMQHFLTPGHSVTSAGACDRERDCAGDRAAFWRDIERTEEREIETRLVVVFMTDEDDCSHGGNIDERVSGNTDLCYSEPERLVDTGLYVDFLRGLKASSLPAASSTAVS